LTSITQGSTTVAIAYDAANRFSTVTLPNSIVGTYTFDNANELQSLAYALGSTSVAGIAYTYDADGRRLTASGTLAGFTMPTATAMTYNSSNRLTSWNGTVPAYDADGNLATFGSTSSRGMPAISSRRSARDRRAFRTMRADAASAM
jgi:hypothetical protein